MDPDENDTLKVFDLPNLVDPSDEKGVFDAVASLEGPFAFVFYQVYVVHHRFSPNCAFSRRQINFISDAIL